MQKGKAIKLGTGTSEFDNILTPYLLGVTFEDLLLLEGHK